MLGRARLWGQWHNLRGHCSRDYRWRHCQQTRCGRRHLSIFGAPHSQVTDFMAGPFDSVNALYPRVSSMDAGNVFEGTWRALLRLTIRAWLGVSNGR